MSGTHALVGRTHGGHIERVISCVRRCEGLRVAGKATHPEIVRGRKWEDGRGSGIEREITTCEFTPANETRYCDPEPLPDWG